MITDVAFVLHHVVLTRAGGGESFGGSSLGGGGFSGGGYYGGGSYYGGYYGGGGIGGFGLLAGLLFGGGPFLFIVIISLVLRAWSMSRRSAMYGGGGGGYGYGAPTQYDDTHPLGVPQGFGVGQQSQVDNVATGIAAIKAHDPAFDENEFVNLAQREFFIVEQAWSECKPELSRRVMADALWMNHNAQIQQYVQKGQRNMMDGLSLASATIVAASSDSGHDRITLRMHAASADYDIDTKTNKVTRGHKDIQEWYEDWTFERSSSAVTKPGGGLASERCPNCGAPLDVDLSGVCSYCKQPVMSGDYDWVLTRIDQVGA